MIIDRYPSSGAFTKNINSRIYRAVQDDTIPYKTIVTTSGDRLDHIAYKEYGEGQNWWIIAAASGIGWWIQVPPGIVLNIPTNLDDIIDIRESS